jgi:hypothetical protein
MCDALFEVSEAKPKSVGKAVMSLLNIYTKQLLLVLLQESFAYIMPSAQDRLPNSWTKSNNLSVLEGSRPTTLRS